VAIAPRSKNFVPLRPKCIATGSRLTGSESDAQDIYQDAFLKAYKNLGSFRFECSFYTWIYRIVTNLCFDHLRKKGVRKEDAPVLTDSEGNEYSLIDQAPDTRATPIRSAT